jgi:hypothetical protein
LENRLHTSNRKLLQFSTSNSLERSSPHLMKNLWTLCSSRNVFVIIDSLPTWRSA